MKQWTMAVNLCLLVLVGCAKSTSIPSDHGEQSALANKTFFEEVGAVTPLNPENPYAAKMKECIYADTGEKSCTIKSFPLIGLSQKAPIQVKDILDRTLVSHDFLGEAFKQVLLRLNPETLQMFGSVSAIVISDKINPSFYYSTASTIYLSGRYFWKNVEEWNLIIQAQAKDSRDDMGLSLQYEFYSGYIKNSKPLASRENRNFQTYDEMASNVSRLLFHELSHANDFFPASFYKDEKLNDEYTYRSMAFERFTEGKLGSALMPTQATSKKLARIGQILYQGTEATSEDIATLAEDIVAEFKKDVASDIYAYSTPNEDFAMASEEALMLYYYNVPRFIVVLKYPMPNFIPPANYVEKIIWGEKSRVLEESIKPRALFAIEHVLGKDISEKAKEKLDRLSPREIPANFPVEKLYEF